MVWDTSSVIVVEVKKSFTRLPRHKRVLEGLGHGKVSDAEDFHLHRN